MATYSYHARVERAQRLSQIQENIGIGQPIKETFSNNVYHILTDTGIIQLVSSDRTTIITVYVATVAEVVAMYNGVKGIPPYLYKKVSKNQTFFTKNGKTVWK